MTKHFSVLLPCAGFGARFGSTIPKQYTQIHGKSILHHTINLFLQHRDVKNIFLLASKNDSYIDDYDAISSKVHVLKCGGDTRSQTVLNGINAINCSRDDWVLVHDAVRCCLKLELLNNLIDTLYHDPVGGILALKTTDTIKKVKNNIINETLKRDEIYLAQTPQMFRFGVLKDSLQAVDILNITDEASAVEKHVGNVRVVDSDSSNIKITHYEDLKLAEYILKSRMYTG